MKVSWWCESQGSGDLGCMGETKKGQVESFWGWYMVCSLWVNSLGKKLGICAIFNITLELDLKLYIVYCF